MVENMIKSTTDRSLSILVNTDQHFDYVKALSRAAHAKGKKVYLYFSGKGVLLTQDQGFGHLKEVAHIAVCENSCRAQNIDAELFKSYFDFLAGPQYLATLLKKCDRNLVF